MKPVKFSYDRPTDLGSALRALGSHENAKLIAGGQSLGPMMNLRAARPEMLIDISRLEELHRIEDNADTIVIGAAVRHADFEDGRVPSPVADLFPRIASGIAYRAVRNRGTVGGSLAHSDPAADWPTVMLALEARIKIRSADGARTINMKELLLAPLETSLAADEAIEAIVIPRRGKTARFGHHKINRQPGEFAEAAAIVVVDRDAAIARAVLSGAKMLPRQAERTGEAIADTLAGRKADLASAIRSDLAREPGEYYDKCLFETCLVRAASEVLGR